MNKPIVKKHNTGFKKPFAWSYSKLKNYENCPRRHYECDLRKPAVFKDGGEALEYGMAVHKALHARIQDDVPLPATMARYEYWARWALSFPGVKYVEQQYAIGAQFQPVSWFGPEAWYRGIGDVVIIDGQTAVIIDWKTGKMEHSIDSVQLALMAQTVFSTFPEVKAVGTKYVFLKEDDEVGEFFTRKDMVKFWPGMLKRIEPLEAAYQSGEYPPKRGFLCAKYCPVTTCEHNGKGNNE